MKKRLILMICVMAVAIGLSACGTKKEETKTEYPKATTEQVQKALKDGNSVVLDARLTDAYAGWKLDEANRGGHIEGSVDFAVTNIKGDYDEKNNLEKLTRDEALADMIKNKKISKDTDVIVYDTNGKDAKVVADYLKDKANVKNISLYDGKQWINNDKLPLSSYPKYYLEVPAKVVKSIIDGKVPEDFKTEGKKIKIIDVRWGNEKESGYLDGHVPTSVHVNTDDFEPPVDRGNGVTDYRLADDNKLTELMIKTGITSDDCIIVTSPEPMAATRFATIAKYLGVKDVRVMSSGFVGWNYEGYKLEKESNAPEKVTDFGSKSNANPNFIDTIAETKQFLASGKGYTLVDNRTKEEYDGKVSGYSYHKLSGRIPGAVYGMAGIGNSSSMYYYRNVDKSMRNADEIKAMWKELGIDTNNHLAFMCGGGWRAAEVFWDAQIMGFENTSLFSDGWCGWSNDGNPSEK